MSVEQIAYAFSAGQLSVRTPLWPPGTSGWQALGNFEQFQAGAQSPDGSYGQLAQFEEADDDPTRMWTGSNEDLSELPGMELPEMMPDMMPMPPEPSMAPQSRPSARTGPRQVAARPRSIPAPPPAAARVASAQASGAAAARSARPRRGSGVWLVAGLVGLVGLGSAVLAARGNWSEAATAPEAPASEASAATAAATPEAPAPAAVPSGESEAAANQARLAKYEDTQPSAFVAEAEGKRPAEAAPAEPVAVADAPEAAKPAREATPVKTITTRSREKAKVSSTTTRRAPPPVVAAKSKPAPEPAEPKVATKEPVKEKEPAKETTKAEAAAPPSSAVNAAAATALGNAAKLASSCRPRGGPSGDGKARVIYSPDGEVQSVEILTAKFRDTLTASCVRMVFRRAKIPAFKGEPPTFIKSFTIPEE